MVAVEKEIQPLRLLLRCDWSAYHSHSEHTILCGYLVMRFSSPKIHQQALSV
jgi:hypothetical protein